MACTTLSTTPHRQRLTVMEQDVSLASALNEFVYDEEAINFKF